MTFSVKTRPVIEKEISIETRKERTNLNLTATIKAEQKILHKERKNWNKDNREMVENPYGNLNRKSIIGLGSRDKTNKVKIENGRVMTWSSQEHGIDERIGKLKYLMYQRQEATDHPSATRLLEYATVGCLVDCGPDWNKDHITRALRHEPHKSALEPDALKALHQGVHKNVQQGYAKIVKFSNIKDNLPKIFKISPVAMISHKSRSYRTILDLSFKLKVENKQLISVNENTSIK